MTRSREIALAATLAALLLAVALLAPGFFAASHLRGLAVDRLPILVAALGATVVIVSGQIDVSLGAQLAVLSAALGAFAKGGLPMPLAILATLLLGLAIGLGNGALVTALRAPALLVTLGTLALLREGLRLVTGGQWIRDLPPGFQWAGLGQGGGTLALAAGVVVAVAATALLLGRTRPGRALFAVGGDPDTARLLGLRPERVRCAALAIGGVLMGLCACVHALRYPAIETEVGLGFELEAIACVVVGGALPSGGRGTVQGTVLGWALFAALGSTLAFLGADPVWEKALAGVLLLLGVAADTAITRRGRAHA